MTEQYYAQHPKKQCKGCGTPRMTWAEDRRQYGRALKRGLSPDEAKALTPRCQKCMTIVLEALARDGTRSRSMW